MERTRQQGNEIHFRYVKKTLSSLLHEATIQYDLNQHHNLLSTHRHATIDLPSLPVVHVENKNLTIPNPGERSSRITQSTNVVKGDTGALRLWRYERKA